MDIVITGQQAWDVEIGSNCKNIALEFSKKHRVLYVNSPLDRISLLKNRKDPKIAKRINVIKKLDEEIEMVMDNLWVLYPNRIIESINWLPSDFAFDVLNKWNNKKFVASILEAVERLNFQNFLHFNDNDIFRSFYLKEYLKPKCSVYYSRDFMLAVDYWKKHGARFEPELIAKSDLCVANSTYLAAYCKRYNDHSFYVGQGCDLEIFSNGNLDPEPEDMISLSRPRIGYVGALQSLRLDIDLLHYVASQRPSWNIVLVGPLDDDFRKSSLHQLKNVIFTGSKNIDQLPAYINSFDVCINPQLLNEVTIGNYPRKIDEYLAVGKPIVATKTDAMSVFADYVYLGETKEDFVNLITLALNEGPDAKADARRAFAASHTWENSVAKIYEAVGEFI